MKAAEYALLISKKLDAELTAVHVVRSEDAMIATNSLRAYPKIILLYIIIQQPKHTNAK